MIKEACRLSVLAGNAATYSGMVLIALSAHAYAADSQVVQRGKVFAQTYCSRCHATGRIGLSPVDDAPPFRTLGRKYPLEDLTEPLVEGLRTGHPLMPEWHLDPADAHDLIVYMKSIQDERPDAGGH